MVLPLYNGLAYSHACAFGLLMGGAPNVQVVKINIYNHNNSVVKKR